MLADQNKESLPGNSFQHQISPDSTGQFAKFCSSPRQVFYTSQLIVHSRLNPKFRVQHITDGEQNDENSAVSRCEMTPIAEQRKVLGCYCPGQHCDTDSPFCPYSTTGCLQGSGAEPQPKTGFGASGT